MFITCCLISQKLVCQLLKKKKKKLKKSDNIGYYWCTIDSIF